MSVFHSFPARRDWSVPAALQISDFPAIESAWRSSRKWLGEISQLLQAADLPVDVLTVAASGSLGRMEAVAGSDADLIIILKDDILPDSPRGQQTRDAVWEALVPLQLTQSRAGGIFALPTTRAALCNVAVRGKIDEDIPTFGKRFQLLCDAQPVYGMAAYEQVLADVIGWYTALSPEVPTVSWWRYLLNDLIRYYRSMSAASLWDHSMGPGFRRTRRFKLAHSRTVMYAALICVLGECSRTAERPPCERLHAMLHLTPLERLAWSYAAADDSGMAIVATAIDRYLACLSDEEFRRNLADDAGEAANDAAFDPISEAASLHRELSRFLNAQQQRWAEDFAAGLWI